MGFPLAVELVAHLMVSAAISLAVALAA